MSENQQVKVNVEYWYALKKLIDWKEILRKHNLIYLCSSGTCGHMKQFAEMTELIQKAAPNVEVTGSPGRQASFEVQVNGELVYSKLQTLAFPDFNEATEMVKGVSEGKPIAKIIKQQPITCVVS